MGPKILFLDLDGTLLDSAKQVSPKNRRAIGRALRAGHKVVINSGRPLASCLDVARTLELETAGCYLAAFGGGIIYDCGTGQPLFSDRISIPLARELLKACRSRGIYCQAYDETGLFVSADGPELAYYRERIPLPVTVDPSLADTLSFAPCKLLAISLSPDSRAVLEAYRKEMAPRMEGKISMVFSSSRYLEHATAGISKGSAIRFLCAHLHIPLADTIAAGDEENDLDMLRAAGIGVAMANAVPSLLEEADYITQRDCDHSGVAEIIERFLSV